VASGHALDLAATTAALCLLGRALRNAPGLRRLQLSLLAAKADMGPAEQACMTFLGWPLISLSPAMSSWSSLLLCALCLLEKRHAM
jgi:hypothetical protein